MAFKQLVVSVFIIAVGVSVAQTGTSAATTDNAPSTVTKPDKEPEPQPTANPPEQMPKVKCAGPGYMCSDCNHQALCVGKGDGTFDQIENSCAKGSHCLRNLCVAEAKCNYRKFKCTTEGFFPDPYDCTQYHVCMYKAEVKTYQALQFKCGEGRGSYDATSGSCGFPLNSTACLEGPVPRCTDALQVGVLKSDRSIYYVCTEDEKTMGPELYKCGGASVFDSSKISCVPAKKK